MKKCAVCKEIKPFKMGIVCDECKTEYNKENSPYNEVDKERVEIVLKDLIEKVDMLQTWLDKGKIREGYGYDKGDFKNYVNMQYNRIRAKSFPLNIKITPKNGMENLDVFDLIKSKPFLNSKFRFKDMKLNELCEIINNRKIYTMHSIGNATVNSIIECIQEYVND